MLLLCTYTIATSGNDHSILIVKYSVQKNLRSQFWIISHLINIRNNHIFSPIYAILIIKLVYFEMRIYCRKSIDSSGYYKMKIIIIINYFVNQNIRLVFSKIHHIFLRKSIVERESKSFPSGTLRYHYIKLSKTENGLCPVAHN